MSYKDYQSKLAPGWLQGAVGKVWQQSLGAEKDLQLDINRQAVLADIPGQAPADALDSIGADRDLPRVSGELDAIYAERLRTCWDGPDSHAFRGSFGGLLQALARAGFPTGLGVGAVIIQRTARYAYISAAGPPPVVTFPPAHSGWTFDWRDTRAWNQFGIVFGGAVATPSALAAGSPAALILDNIVKTWKPAKALYMGTWVETTGPFWGWPIGTALWGAVGRNWGGSAVYLPPL